MASAAKRWQALRDEAAHCRGCDLWQRATQTVFGAGPLDAAIMLVGEQPGDQEDQAGEPFVGPAGRVLDEALVAAGIERDSVYVTNAVKHFKWTERGKRRIHEKPNRAETVACRSWLEGEIEAVAPAVVVALGATAAQSLLGPKFRVTQHHAEVLTGTGVAPKVLATVHPSVVLRGPDPAAREVSRRLLVETLELAGREAVQAVDAGE